MEDPEDVDNQFEALKATLAKKYASKDAELDEMKQAHNAEKQNLETKAQQAEERAIVAEGRAAAAEGTIRMWKTKYEKLMAKARGMLEED
jgi:hypothetical protein